MWEHNPDVFFWKEVFIYIYYTSNIKAKIILSEMYVSIVLHLQKHTQIWYNSKWNINISLGGDKKITKIKKIKKKRLLSSSVILQREEDLTMHMKKEDAMSWHHHFCEFGMLGTNSAAFRISNRVKIRMGLHDCIKKKHIYPITRCFRYHRYSSICS